MDKITIVCNNDSVVLPLNDNKTLSLELLKEYFPYANGLVYTKKDVVKGLLIRNGMIQINPDVNTYMIHVAQGNKQ